MIAALRILVDAPLEIHHVIYDWLPSSRGRQTVRIYKPKLPGKCCRFCETRFSEQVRQASWVPHRVVSKVWSPWTLTQVSKAWNKHWRDFYYRRTEHLICIAQLGDYLNTYFGKEGCTMSGYDRDRPPVHIGRVDITAKNITQCSLHLLIKALKLIPSFHCQPLCQPLDHSSSKRGKRTHRRLSQFIGRLFSTNWWLRRTA